MWLSPSARSRAVRTALLFGALALPFAGCDSSGGDDDPDPDASGDFSLRADGERITFQGAAGGILDGSGGSVLSVGAANTNDSSAGFLVEAGEGTYEIGDGDGDLFLFYTDEDGNEYVATSGTLTVESLDDDSVRGTFEFEGETGAGDQVDVTDGEFDVPIVEVPE